MIDMFDACFELIALRLSLQTAAKGAAADIPKWSNPDFGQGNNPDVFEASMGVKAALHSHPPQVFGAPAQAP